MKNFAKYVFVAASIAAFMMVAAPAVKAATLTPKEQTQVASLLSVLDSLGGLLQRFKATLFSAPSTAQAASAWSEFSGYAQGRIKYVNNKLYAIGTDNGLYKYANNAWSRIGSGGDTVKDDFHILSENDIYAIGADNHVYHYGSAWTELAGNGLLQKKVYFDSAAVYGIGLDNGFYKWNGTAWNLVGNGSASDFVIAGPSKIYTIGTNSHVYLWNGSAWIELAGNGLLAKDITYTNSSGYETIYGIGADNRVYKWQQGIWSGVGNGYAKHLKVVSDSEMYAIGSDDKLWKWDGSSWNRLGDFLLKDDIAVTPSAEIYAIRMDNRVVKWAEGAAGPFTLTVTKPGTGSGTVTDNATPDPLINCGSSCSVPYTSGTSVILTATAASGSTFAGWSGEGCSGTGTCIVTMTAAKNVTATFNGSGGDTTPPSVPTNLTATAFNSTQINVSWTAPGDDGTTGTVTSYDLRHSTSPITSSNFSNATQDTFAGYIAPAGLLQSVGIANLIPNTTYYFAVKAFDEAGNSSPIAYASGTTLPTGGGITAPTITTSCGGTGSSVSQATISWSNTNDPTGYDVEIDTDSNLDGYWKKFVTNAGATNTIAPDGFTAFGNVSGSLTLSGGSAYKARIKYYINGQRSSDATFTAQTCGGGAGVPTVTKLSLPTTTLVSGAQTLYKFQVTAPTTNDIALYKMTFPVATSGIVQMRTTLPAFRVFNATENKFINLAVGNTASYFDTKEIYDNVGRLLVRIYTNDTTNYANPYVTIPAGQTHIFELRATGSVTVSGSSVASVTTDLLGDAASLSGAVADIEGKENSNFIWAPGSSSLTVTSITWKNGFTISSLPSTGLGTTILTAGGGGDIITITNPSSLPAATTGTFYSVTFTATGGSQPYQWQQIGGSVPAGLSGLPVLSGTPSNAEISQFRLRATDSAGASGEKDFTIVVSGGGGGGNDGSATTALATGNPVIVTAAGNGLAVRASPNGSLVRHVNTATKGTVDCSQAGGIACPTIQSGLVWWYIDYQSGSDGWSAEKFVNPAKGEEIYLKYDTGTTVVGQCPQSEIDRATALVAHAAGLITSCLQHLSTCNKTSSEITQATQELGQAAAIIAACQQGGGGGGSGSYSVSVSPASVVQGALTPLTITWTAPSNHSATSDWVGLFKQGDPDTDAALTAAGNKWALIPAGTSGTITQTDAIQSTNGPFVIPNGAAAGSIYEMRILTGNDPPYTRQAVSQGITVTSSGGQTGGATLRIVPSTITAYGTNSSGGPASFDGEFFATFALYDPDGSGSQPEQVLPPGSVIWNKGSAPIVEYSSSYNLPMGKGWLVAGTPVSGNITTTLQVSYNGKTASAPLQIINGLRPPGAAILSGNSPGRWFTGLPLKSGSNTITSLTVGVGKTTTMPVWISTGTVTNQSTGETSLENITGKLNVLAVPDVLGLNVVGNTLVCNWTPGASGRMQCDNSGNVTGVTTGTNSIYYGGIPCCGGGVTQTEVTITL